MYKNKISNQKNSLDSVKFYKGQNLIMLNIHISLLHNFVFSVASMLLLKEEHSMLSSSGKSITGNY